MRVAVTGGAGFVGRAVCAELFRRDIDCVALDIVAGWDVRTDAIPAVDAVIHLAGLLGTHELFDAVRPAIDVNIGGTAHVLEQCRQIGARYVGITMLPVFPSIYTATRIGSTAIERAYHHAYGLPVSLVRAFNAYGPWQGHGPTHPQKILPTFAVEAWAGRPIPIWGDGTQTVDLVHVDDVARALVDALDHGDGVTIDAGTGVPLTVNEVAEQVIKITGSPAGVEYLPMRRGEIPTTVVASGEGWDRLDWRPQLDWDRVAEVVRWYRRPR